MVKRQNSTYVWQINGRKGKYMVIMERLKNTRYGNPRWKAIIIYIDEENILLSYYNAVYTFNGHYMDVEDEAKYIVEYHEKEIGE